MKIKLALPFLALPFPVLAGCGGEPGFVVEHDGSVPVVKNFTPEWGDTPEWEIGPYPTLSIPQWSAPGARDSAHLTDAKQLPDGTIAIANGFRGEIGVFTQQARLVRRFGSKGLAAGEFQTLSSVHVIDDEIWAFDKMGRWNVFDLEGSLTASIYMEPRGRPWPEVEPYGGEMAILASTSPPPGATGRVRPPASVVRYEMSGAQTGTLVDLPGREYFVDTEDRRTVTMLQSFGPSPVIHGGRNVLYAGSGDDMRIEVYGEDGSLERVVGIPELDLTVSDEEWAEEVAWFEERQRERADMGLWAPTPGPGVLDRRETKPAYERLMEDARGNLWVAEFTPLYRRRGPSNRWTIFDPEGRWLGTMETPADLRLTEIGEDYLLGIDRTDGRSVVHRYALKR